MTRQAQAQRFDYQLKKRSSGSRAAKEIAWNGATSVVARGASGFVARCAAKPGDRGKMNCGRLWLNFLRDIRPLSEELPLAVRIAVH
jgi:hypothetical protein